MSQKFPLLSCLFGSVFIGLFGQCVLVKLLPLITNISVAVINFGTFFIIITLLVKSPKQSAEFVFKNIINETGWSSNGVVFFLGMLPSLACVTLFDGAVHLTDEIAQPERNIPLVMVISNTLSGVMAFFAAIVYMFCVVNVDNLSNPLVENQLCN